MNINEFIGNFNGGARPNRFRVTLNYPGFAGNPATPSRFVCRGAQLPASTIGIVNVPYMGREIKYAGDRTFEDWTVTIINDEKFDHRASMERWMNGLNSHQGNTRVNPALTAYSQIVTVDQLSYNGGLIRRYKMYNMFPTNLSAIDLDMSTNDTIEEFQVTFAFSHWEADGTS